MYILYYKLNFSFKSLFTKRFWLRLITKTASQSKYHHTDHTLPYKKDTIVQAHSPVYRHIFYLDYFKSMGNVDVYAHKVIKKVNKDKWRDIEGLLLGSKYDTRGAISSESHGLIKQKRNDEAIFCSEAHIILYLAQKWIKPVDNKNDYSPQENLELELDKKIISPVRIKVWDGKKQKLLINIFE